LQWFGRTCVRLKGRDAVVVADAYQAIVGPTGRGITGDIVTFSHPDDDPLPRPVGPTIAWYASATTTASLPLRRTHVRPNHCNSMGGFCHVALTGRCARRG
jgi:hypothetical protein